MFVFYTNQFLDKIDFAIRVHSNMNELMSTMDTNNVVTNTTGKSTKARERESKKEEKALEKEKKREEKALEKEKRREEKTLEKERKTLAGRNKRNAKENEEKDILDIVNAINTRNTAGIKLIKNLFDKTGMVIESARSVGHDGKKIGGRNTHYDFEVEIIKEGIHAWYRVEHKGSQLLAPIDTELPPWSSGVQFYNGSASKFVIGFKYATAWYVSFIESGIISQKYGIVSEIPSCDEWVKRDAMQQGDPNTPFGIELKQKFRELNPGKSLTEERNTFVDSLFTVTDDDLEILKKEAFLEATRVLKEKDLWLQIHGNINEDFHCEWNLPLEICEIKSARVVKKGSRDVNFEFECNDNFKFGGILRWGKGMGFSNLRIDLK